jgi:hypothetical protein
MNESVGYLVSEHQLMKIEKALRSAETWLPWDSVPPSVRTDVTEGLRSVRDIRGENG